LFVYSWNKTKYTVAEATPAMSNVRIVRRLS